MGSIANFFPTIVKTLGYSSINTLLLTAPPYVFAGAYYYVMTWYSDVSLSPAGAWASLTVSEEELDLPHHHLLYLPGLHYLHHRHDDHEHRSQVHGHDVHAQRVGYVFNAFESSPR